MASHVDDPPSYVRGRKGAVSVTDALVAALWRARDGWPVLSLTELRETVSETLQYAVASSTVRSSVYSRPDLFERTPDSADLRYRLTSKARKRVGALASDGR